MGQAWYVAKTKPRQEVQTSLVLDQRGLETYFPLIGPRPHRSARKEEPLFPGYLFVRLNPLTPDWVRARSAPGVAYFLGPERQPAPLPDGVVEQIRQLIEQGSRSKQNHCFRPGDRVKILGGPLDEVVAIFDGTLSAKGRCRVLVSIVNRLVPVTLAIEQLERAS